MYVALAVCVALKNGRDLHVVLTQFHPKMNEKQDYVCRMWCHRMSCYSCALGFQLRESLQCNEWLGFFIFNRITLIETAVFQE